MADDDLERVSDGFRVRLRFGKGQRQRFVIRLHDETAARERRAKLVELASMLTESKRSLEAPAILRKGASVTTKEDFAEVIKFAEGLCAPSTKKKAARNLMTFAQLAERWTDGTLHREHPDHVGTKKTSELDEARFKSINAVVVDAGVKFGDLPVDAVTLDHCSTVMSNLPDSARRPATRRQYAQLVHRVLELAVFPCRLIKASPLPRGFMPKIGKPPGFAYLYPDEDATLLGAPPAAVPLCFRILWGFLDREGPRSGEAVNLRIGVDVDLARGVIKLDENKTDDPRAWAMGPDVTAALAAWVKLRGAKKGDLVFVGEDGAQLDNEKLAEVLRAHLKAAGVDRPELFDDGANTRRMRVHDLRGTFVTLSLANGKTETWVMDRTGHTTSAMLNRYRRASRSATELGLGPLAPLSDALPEIAAFLRKGGPKGGPEAKDRSTEPVAKHSKRQVKAEVAEWQTRRTQNPSSADANAHESLKQGVSDTLTGMDEHDGPGGSAGVGQVDLDAVIADLRAGLARAGAAGEWKAVEILEARLRGAEEERAGNVIALDARRGRDGRRSS